MENIGCFIVGCPRTGSTLLRQILNKSNRICIVEETFFLHRWSRVGIGKKIVRFEDLKDDNNANKFIDHIFSAELSASKSYWGWLNKNVDKQVFKHRFLGSDRSERGIFVVLMRIYAEYTQGAITEDLVLGEKTPSHLYYVPILLEWFPKAKIIHTFRDPRGIFVSASRLVKSGRWNMRAKLPPMPEWMTEPSLSVLEMFHITKLWFDAVRLHRQYEQQYPERYCLVRFEDLIYEPERQIQNICTFLELPFEREMLEEVKIVGSSFSTQRDAHHGFDRKATERWKEHIHPLARAWFSILGRKHLQKFGYTP